MTTDAHSLQAQQPVVIPDRGIDHAVVEAVPLDLDTTRGSPLHALLAGRAGHPPSATRAYAISIAVTYLPLAIAAFLSPIPVMARSATVRLPFLHDWNVAFTFLVSFPCLVVLIVTDQTALTTALRRVQLDGILSMTGNISKAFVASWERRFRNTNRLAYATGVLAGLVLASLNYIAYTPPNVGYWIARRDTLQLSGYVLLYCIFILFALIPVYVIRSITTSFFLRDIVGHSELRMLPFHPDRCGGLRPVGRLGLRNQYALTVFGLNVVALVIVSIRYLNVPRSLYGLMAAAVIAYVILGPFVFLGPLLSFRSGMLRTKAELMGEIAQRLRIELQRLRGQLAGGTITKEDEELIDRLRKVGGVIDELPVWPFDAGTLRKFLTAYVVPLVGAVALPFAKTLLEQFVKQLGG